MMFVKYHDWLLKGSLSDPDCLVLVVIYVFAFIECAWVSNSLLNKDGETHVHVFLKMGRASR